MSSLSSKQGYENQVEQRAGYHQGLGPEDASSCKNDDSSTSAHLCDRNG